MPAEPEIEVRPAWESDLPAVVSFVRLCLGPGSVPRSLQFWRWKHELGPFGPSPVLLAMAGGEIVGLRAFLRWRLRCGGRDVDAVRAVDTATHPQWRGRGIFSRLTRELVAREAERGTAFVFNTPNRSSGSGYRKMGWRAVGRIPMLVRPKHLVRPLYHRLLGRPPSAPDVIDFPTVDDLLQTPIGYGLLDAPGVKDDFRYRMKLSKEYLAWRYSAIPGFDYRALWSEDDETSAAVVFRSRVRRGLREVLVTEIMAEAGAAGVRAAARVLRRLASAAGADYLAAVAFPYSPERAALLRAGFLPAPGLGSVLHVRELAIGPGRPDVTRISSWSLTAGSLELF